MIKRLITTAAFALAVSGPASSAVINYIEDNTNPVSVPGLAGFATTGAMMNGLAVTACFLQGVGCETRLWAATGPTTGGVTGTNWALSVTGDTFSAPWNFTNDQAGQLESLRLNGNGTFTMFDRTEPSFGTDGSASGRDWTTGLNAGTLVNVTYINPTGVGGNPPVGDLFRQVLVEFLDETGPRVSFTFLQDSDNDVRITQVPEPSPLVLFGLALAMLGFVRRRRI